MYLHIGNNKNIRLSSMIGIFDLDSASTSGITKTYLREKEKAGLTEYVSTDLPKSFILTSDGKVWFSPISAGTLRARAENEFGIRN